MPTFENRDAASPKFWTERFEHHFTPWDRGGVPEAFKQFVAQSPRPLVTLIPGCGVGYEVAYLGEAGWDVTAIDFSPAAVAAARTVLGQWGSKVVEADFFAFAPSRPVDFIYERAFLCALPRRLWPEVARHWSELLAPGGVVAGYFYFNDDPKGPPFGTSPAELDTLMSGLFERIGNDPVTDSIPIFAGKEYWQVWRRLPLA
jgi:SAM-dependent methyltransferase